MTTVKGVNLQRLISELSFSIGLADQLTEDLKEGRAKNLFEKLEKKTLNIFREIGSILGRPISKEERQQAHDLIMEFGDISGWRKKTLHPITKVNFLLALYDKKDKPFVKPLIEILMDIHEFVSRKKRLPDPVYWAAGKAADKWEALLRSKGLWDEIK